jgi:hypothetical protein
MPVSGTGIPSSTTILSVDSATQITLSQNASSSGSSTVVVAPWGVGDGSTTFNVPNFTTAGRYRRSRTSSLRIGLLQAEEVGTHLHAVSLTTGSSGTHNHGGATGNPTTNPAHSAYGDNGSQATGGTGRYAPDTNAVPNNLPNHVHTISSDGAHTHTVSGNTANNSGTETRPVTAVVLTCIKT